MIIKTFIVEGEAAFPLDMLRYDQAYPKEARDSTAILASLAGTGPGGRTRIELSTAKKYSPTAGLWERHHWKVISVS